MSTRGSGVLAAVLLAAVLLACGPGDPATVETEGTAAASPTVTAEATPDVQALLDSLDIATAKPTPETAGTVKPVPEWAALAALYRATNGES